MTDKNCVICGSSDCRVFPSKFFKNVLSRCQKCGLIFVERQPEFAELKKIYGQNYFKNTDSNSIGYEDYLADKPNIVKTFEKRLKNIEKLYPKTGKILDVGCATGFFLEVAENHGWTPYGAEISDYAGNMAKKRFRDNVFQSVFDKALPNNNFFDIITMWDYLEHVPNPAKELVRAWQLLKKDGILILSTPDAGSLPHKIFRDKWMGYKDQEHLYYFSEKNLKILLGNTGFKILKSEKIGKYISFNLFAKRLGLYSKSLADILKFLTLKTNASNFSVYINPLDIICIYAKK